MNEDEPRELSLDEIDALAMQAIDQITARLPVRDYRTAKAEDGSSSHVMEFDQGARFEVIYDREGRPASPSILGRLVEEEAWAAEGQQAEASRQIRK